MLKGQKRYRSIKPFDIPPGDYYITQIVAPHVSPYYMISKEGFIYNRYSRRFISGHMIQKDIHMSNYLQIME